MRHRKGFNHLGRTSAHRKAMLANMATSLIMNKRITTTTAKAKELRSYVEPLITKSKDDSTHSRRVVFSYLKNKFAVSELFREISPKITDRPGGYTRILKIGNRLGDNADMCIIELVDYNENMLGEKGSKAKSTRRRRGSGRKKEETAVKEAAPVTNAEVAEEEEVVSDSNVSEEVETVDETAEETTEETTEQPAAETDDQPAAETAEQTADGKPAEDEVAPADDNEADTTAAEEEKK